MRFVNLNGDCVSRTISANLDDTNVVATSNQSAGKDRKLAQGFILARMILALGYARQQASYAIRVATIVQHTERPSYTTRPVIVLAQK